MNLVFVTGENNTIFNEFWFDSKSEYRVCVIYYRDDDITINTKDINTVFMM
mgnify:FL=1